MTIPTKYPTDVEPDTIVAWLRSHVADEPDYATRCALQWAAYRIEMAAASVRDGLDPNRPGM